MLGRCAARFGWCAVRQGFPLQDLEGTATTGTVGGGGFFFLKKKIDLGHLCNRTAHVKLWHPLLLAGACYECFNLRKNRQPSPIQENRKTGEVAAYVPHTAHLSVMQVATNVGIPMLCCLQEAGVTC